MREFDNRTGEQWALLRRTSPNVKLAIFVHGFNGDYLSTWGKFSELLRSQADTDAVFTEWDFLFLGYSTGTVETYLDIAAVIATQWQKARHGHAPFRQVYEQVALFGHSLGTLGIRQLLCANEAQPDGHLNDLKGVVLFGTPFNGSGLAKFAFLSNVADSLKPSNPQLRMLRSWSTGVHRHLPWPQVRIVLGLDDKVVGATGYTAWPGDISPPDITNFDHSTLVKPTEWSSSVVNSIQNALR